jgi:hypothetical protein
MRIQKYASEQDEDELPQNDLGQPRDQATGTAGARCQIASIAALAQAEHGERRIEVCQRGFAFRLSGQPGEDLGVEVDAQRVPGQRCRQTEGEAESCAGAGEAKAGGQICRRRLPSAPASHPRLESVACCGGKQR